MSYSSYIKSGKPYNSVSFIPQFQNHISYHIG